MCPSPLKTADELPQALAQFIDSGVGSSRTITGGLCTSAWATSTRRFMPPTGGAC